jgi:hypothetical protein
MVTKVSPGITITYQTPTGEWLTGTELDCIGLELKGNWKKKQGMWIGSALQYYIEKDISEYVYDSQWKIA